MGGAKNRKKAKKPKRGHSKGVSKDPDAQAAREARKKEAINSRFRGTKENSIPGKKANEKFTVDQLMEKAEEYIDTFEFDLAQKFCQRALDIEPHNVRALETSGNLLTEMGELENAKKCFEHAVEVCPDTGYSKYMYLGQLLGGAEGVQLFSKGIEIMKVERSTQSQAASASSHTVSGQELSRAYCSVAEIYLTDLCDEEGADVKCKVCLDQALEEDADNPEAYQLMASYLLSQDNSQPAYEDHLKNAKSMMEKSLSLWLPQMQANEPETQSSDDTEQEEGDQCPLSYLARIAGAKILTELKMFEPAIDILERLLEEDDEVVEVWYLLGNINCLINQEENKAPARFYLAHATEVFKAVCCDDEEMLANINKLLEELGPGVEGEDDSEDEVDETIDSEGDSEDDEAMEH